MEFDPLGIFLATLCTGGEKLLFRYPSEAEENHSKPNIVLSSHSYALKMPLIPQYSVCKESQLTNIKNGIVVGFEDFLLANLLISSKSNTPKRRYEVQVGDVIFVGFMHAINICTSSKKRETEKITFNVVFALQAGIKSHFIPLYQELSEKISLALIHEEERTAFMSRQKQLITELHETMQSYSEKVSDRHLCSNVHERASVTSPLGILLRSIYESICESGTVDVFLNSWVRISFTISPKVPRGIVASSSSSSSTIGLNNNSNGAGPKKRPLLFSKPSLLQEYLREMRPYHSFILLEDRRLIVDRLTMDCSPVLMRLLKVYTPLKSMDQLAAELDVALTQVRRVVCSLVVWGLAMIIYPIYDSNIYLLSPSANLAVNSPLSFNFSLEFPNLFLPRVLEEFSSPFSFGYHRENLGSPGQDTKVLIWLLQHRLVYQLHTYPYFDDFSIKENSSSQDLIGEGGFGRMINGSLSTNNNLNGSLESVFNSSEVLSTSRREIPVSAQKEEEVFRRLATNYFNGLYHLEAIMYRESISRTELCHLIDRFRDKLYVIKHEEPLISYWVSSDG